MHSNSLLCSHKKKSLNQRQFANFVIFISQETYNVKHYLQIISPIYHIFIWIFDLDQFFISR